MDLPRRLLAEFIGTFALVFVGIGALTVGAERGGSLLTVALAFGFVVAVMVSATAHISGGQFNPAVSIALVAVGRMVPRDAVAYVLTQMAGATAASLVLLAMFGKAAVANGTPILSKDAAFGPVAGAVMELLMTFFLVFVVFGVAVDRRGANPLAGLLIGLTVTLDILFGGPYTGASMNPARSFGPALVSNTWTSGWVYWVGPIAGGVMAALLYENVFLRARRSSAATGTTTPPPAGP